MMTTYKKQPTFVELVLTCASWQEAQRIVDHLLQQRLIACAEFIPVKSKFHYKGKLDESDEIRLVMETVEHFFEDIEAEVAKLHSYETFVLKAIPISKLSKAASVWWQSSLGDAK